MPTSDNCYYKIKKKKKKPSPTPIKKVLAGIIKLSWPAKKNLTSQLRTDEAQEEL